MTLDIANIVPSTRDFLQAIATRRKTLALVALVERTDDAKALVDGGIAAIACPAADDCMRDVSAAIGSIPLVLLAPITGETDALLARAVGADAVVVGADTGSEEWNLVAQNARTTRMAAVARVTDESTAIVATRSMAKAALLQVGTLAEVKYLMPKLGSLRTLAQLPSVDEASLRALRGLVDAVIVESDLFLSTSFATLVEELER